MRSGYAFAAFTEKGRLLAEKLCERTGGTVDMPGDAVPLSAWTDEQFRNRAALIFVGAAGIAVRAIAPHLKSKTEDPAVLCVDECGRHVIPLLSGHLGGANRLARHIALICGGEAVLTTATDLEGLFAVDLWAQKQGMTVLQPERIRQVSAKILRGETVKICCPYPIAGAMPERVEGAGEPAEADIIVSCRIQSGNALQLVPRVLSLGIGCRRGTERGHLREVFGAFCGERGILPQAIAEAATVDLKRDEEGLTAFCGEHGWPLKYYSAAELRTAQGEFTGSDFVKMQVGVDNVCERAACLAGGMLVEKKYAAEGITFALAEYSREYDWSW